MSDRDDCCGDAADCTRECERRKPTVPAPKVPYDLNDNDRRFLKGLRIKTSEDKEQ